MSKFKSVKEVRLEQIDRRCVNLVNFLITTLGKYDTFTQLVVPAKEMLPDRTFQPLPVTMVYLLTDKRRPY